MLKIFKKLLGKSDKPVAATPAPRVVATPTAPKVVADQAHPMPQVEVAHLSLAAIMQKLPEDLKRTIARAPDASATVALPLATIQKQLPTGSVKMSLASLYRQAPAGTFSQTRVEDRRMVDVPLSEIFRHVSPDLLPKRGQRRVELPEDAVGLFGDGSNPYALAPGVPEEAARPAAAAPQVPRVIQPPMEMRTQAPGRAGNSPGASQVQSRGVQQPKATPRGITPPTGLHSTAQRTPAASPSEPPLLLSIADLAGNWPEPIRSEALAMDGAQVALPVGPLTAGLAKGKIAFTWGQIRSWLNPAPETPTQAQEITELVLPLKVVAPAFLAHSKPKTTRKSYALDDSIPALFSGGQKAPDPEPEAAAPAPTVEETPVEARTEPAQPEPLPTAPSVIAPPADLQTATEAPAAEPAESAEPAQAAPAVLPAPAPPGTKSKQALSELLGNPDKEHWSPPELVKATGALPGVAGAVVGLQEGLLVAAQLPEHMKGDTVAAFLPQIFARLTNYAGEMKLGGVQDILFTTNGAHFQIYRLGEIYFAVLGKPGESLPWEGLRLIVEELAHHHQK